MLKMWLLSNVFTMRPAIDAIGRFCSAEGDAPAGGGGGDAAAAAAAAEAAKPTTLLGTATDATKDGKDATKDGKDATVVVDDKTPAAETPEAKAERLKNETPEAKTAREAKEKADGDAKVAATLKTYEAVKMPDGVTRDQPAVQDFLKQAAADGMPLEKAQAYVDSVAPKLKAAVEAPYKAWEDMQTKWIGELKEDKEVGGAKLQENLGFAAKALDTFAGAADSVEGKAVREALEFTGAGNNPAMVRMMVRIGKKLAESGPLGGSSKTADKDLAAMMYPSMGAKT